MTFKDLLVVVDNDPTCVTRVDLALALAAEHQAHLTGLHVMPWPVIQVYSEMPVPESFEKMQRLELEEASRRAAAVFAERAARTTVPTEWRAVEGDAVRVTREHARYSDLTLIPQGLELGAASADLSMLPEELALAVGRPVVVIPRYGKFERIGKRVLVAWNGSREATRAVHDALPMLQRAEHVTVLSIDPEGDTDRLAGGDIARHLARHGVTVQAATIAGTDVAVGDLLLSYASDHDIDLIVMGAYGHTRLREVVLGGATRSLLRHMTVPVLMSH